MSLRSSGLRSHRRGFAFPRHIAPESCKGSPSKMEGAGNAGCALHPRSRVQDAQKKTHTSIQVQRRQSGIPCAMALRLMPCSPRRRIRLVTVAAGLMAASDPVGSIAPPTAWHQQRVSGPRGFAVRTNVVRLARREPLTSLTSPCDHPARRRCRVHRIPPRVRDDRETPLLSRRDSAEIAIDLG